ncbi:phosphoadenosine phosphosulfate reductase domain-containing protein [Vibrio parahaemolyticus]|uniref:phosphoadenosine phosphosulfate reductase domain-containing protein n=1 Tax=Vibrio parahaemolyticus TaxID=670 RepID=UPI003892AD0B
MGINKKKRYIDIDVESKAKERIRYLYETFDNVAVSFSAGKDSTAMLLLTIEVAQELGKLPVRVIFFDEEAIHPPTIEYAQRVSNRPDVDFEWYCLPFKHRNACSNDSPFWYCWDPEKVNLWVRDMPSQGIHQHDCFSIGDTFVDFSDKLMKFSNFVLLQGIRTQESMRRFRAVAKKKNENYIIRKSKGVIYAYPVYDMSSEDVWRVVANRSEDYNRTYDYFNRTSLYNRLLHQRVCPPYGEEPLRGLWIYAECFPELWHKMIYRVPGAATAARYGNTELYSRAEKPEGITYRQYIESILMTYSGDHRTFVTKNINAIMEQHGKKTPDPIPDERPHPLTGVSWAFLAKAATRGDFKGRVGQLSAMEAESECERLGITQEQAQKLYGRKGSK